jgi:hypothetical protein
VIRDEQLVGGLRQVVDAIVAIQRCRGNASHALRTDERDFSAERDGDGHAVG